MTPNRRRVLTAVGAVLLTGCSELDSAPGEPARTVTPVEVPQSAESTRRRVDNLAVPEIPASVVVTDEHRRAVTAAVEELVETAEREFEAAKDVELAAIEDEIRNSQDPFNVARLILQRLRMSQAPRTYRRLGQGFGDIGTILGYVRAETGELDVASLLQAMAETRTGVSSLRNDFDYRLATPVQELFPTVVAAERALVYAESTLQDARQAIERLDGATNPESAAVGRAWGHLERTWLATRNAAGFLTTATESARSPRRDVIERAIETEREEAAAVEESQLTVADGAPASIRTSLREIRSRRSDLVTATINELAAGARAQGLFRAAKTRAEIEAFRVAVAAIEKRADEPDAPEERLLAARKAAIERLARLESATPLQRQLGRFAAEMVRRADRQRSGRPDGAVLTTRFMYVSARAFTDHMLSRGASIAEALGSGDSQASRGIAFAPDTTVEF